MKTSSLILTLFASAALASGGCGPSNAPELSNNAKETTPREDQLHRGYTQSRFGQIHYRAVKPKQARFAPVMALHLSPNSSQVFSDFLPIMGADRIAIAPDYPGYGMSDAIEGEQTISDYARAMLDVIERQNLSTPVDLVGYHTGAGVALEMARQEPDLIGRIVLVAVPVLTKEEREAGAALPRIAFDLEGEFAKKEWQSSWRWRGPGQDQTSVLATFGEKFRPGARERGAQAILAYDLIPVLEKASHPLMIVRVKDDLWEPSKRAHDMRPDAEYAELPDYGHGLFHVAPDHMRELITNFLDKAATD